MINLEKTLFIDIETIPQYMGYLEFHAKEETTSDLFDLKYVQTQDGWENFDSEKLDEIYIKKASLNAEFGKVLTFSVGALRFNQDTKTYEFKNNSFSGLNEIEVLEKLKSLLIKVTKADKDIVLCGHNIIGFDIPFLCKRYVINGMEIPEILNLIGKKPWEIKHIDTMRLWQFGTNDMISLDLLSKTLKLDVVKGDFDGKTLFKLLRENIITLDDITEYCYNDTKIVSDVILKIKDLI